MVEALLAIIALGCALAAAVVMVRVWVAASNAARIVKMNDQIVKDMIKKRNQG